MQWSARDYLIAFNMVSGIGGRRLMNLEKHFGSLKRAWHATPNELNRVFGFGIKTVEKFLQSKSSISPQIEEEWAHKREARIITLLDSEYPASLKMLAVPPPVLYVQGSLPEEDCIAVVGTRKPSKFGIAQAKQFTAHLVKNNIAVVSGLARGIDYAAHVQAVQMGGKTIAVLGSNLANLYPAEHRALVEKIKEQGAVITEFSSRCPTVPGNFPRRNRLLAGLSKGVLVVQAGERSGSIITADWALEQGLDVWAIPGEISDPLRRGCHTLIQQGAFLVTQPDDLVQGQSSILSGEGQDLLQLYEAGYHANEIAATLQRPVSEILAEITLLEIKRC